VAKGVTNEKNGHGRHVLNEGGEGGSWTGRESGVGQTRERGKKKATGRSKSASKAAAVQLFRKRTGQGLTSSGDENYHTQKTDRGAPQTKKRLLARRQPLTSEKKLDPLLFRNSTKSEKIGHENHSPSLGRGGRHRRLAL